MNSDIELKEMRRILRLTQAELATILGVNQSHICKIEKGKHSMTKNMTRAVEELCDLRLYQGENGNEK
ncbi:MAG: hypothetical protein A2W23_08630 [Planctomycetes bacterium RBG_16_43_13]|nr:MAG: hypothetical protein A2W23_08630 [Planctomycetes bacterium RBG_16_43_13]